MSVSSLAEYLLTFRAGLGRVKGKAGILFIVTIYTMPSVLVACPLALAYTLHGVLIPRVHAQQGVKRLDVVSIISIHKFAKKKKKKKKLYLFYLAKYSLSDAHFKLLFEFNRLQYTFTAPEVFVASANPVSLPSGYRVSIVRNTNINQIETTPMVLPDTV